MTDTREQIERELAERSSDWASEPHTEAAKEWVDRILALPRPEKAELTFDELEALTLDALRYRALRSVAECHALEVGGWGLAFEVRGINWETSDEQILLEFDALADRAIAASAAKRAVAS